MDCPNCGALLTHPDQPHECEPDVVRLRIAPDGIDIDNVGYWDRQHGQQRFDWLPVAVVAAWGAVLICAVTGVAVLLW